MYIYCIYCIYIYTYIYIYTQYMYAAVSNKNGKRKPSRFPLICLLFAHRANGSLSFVRLLTKKETELIRLLMD